MASWSTKRKYGYFVIFIAAVAVVIGIPAYFTFHHAPTCFDGVENGTETGIDCGGSCARLCPADFAMPRVIWTYSAQIEPGFYNALAYLQNPNPTVQAKAMGYDFKLFDNQGILITERTGSMFVPAGQKFAAFEPDIQTGNRVPAITTFSFTTLPDWTQGAPLTQLQATNVSLDQSSQPKAQVTIKNIAADKGFSNVTAFIILYDKDDNRVSFSKTVIDSIGPSADKTLYYTWPQAFLRSIVRTEVLFVQNP